MNRRIRGPQILVLVLLAGFVAPGVATVAAQGRPGAQPSVWEVTPQQNPSEFVPLKDLPQQQREQLPAAPLVMGAYAFVWVALLVYVWSLWRRVGAVQRELADLRKRTERK